MNASSLDPLVNAPDAWPWRVLIELASQHGEGPYSLLGVLVGFRCFGVQLVVRNGAYCLMPGELDVKDYARWKAQYLMPHAALLTALLDELGAAMG